VKFQATNSAHFAKLIGAPLEDSRNSKRPFWGFCETPSDHLKGSKSLLDEHFAIIFSGLPGYHNKRDVPQDGPRKHGPKNIGRSERYVLPLTPPDFPPNCICSGSLPEAPANYRPFTPPRPRCSPRGSPWPAHPAGRSPSPSFLRTAWRAASHPACTPRRMNREERIGRRSSPRSR
jgi:hypothetical protein